MTEEQFDNILKQSLSPAINDSEIRIQRKPLKTAKRVIPLSVYICAVTVLIVIGVLFIKISSTSKNTGRNIFALTAYAAELPENVTSGEFLGIAALHSSYSSEAHLGYRFYISGENIEKLSVTTNKCNIYYAVPTTKEAFEKNLYQNTMYDGYFGFYDINGCEYYEHLVVPGTTYEGEYCKDMSFGMSVPQEYFSDNEDPKEGFYETTYQVDGATLTIKVTFTDGSEETHHYKLTVGKIYVPHDENGRPLFDNPTRFVQYEGESGTIGYLITQID